MQSTCIPKPPCPGIVKINNIMGSFTTSCSLARKKVVGIPTNIKYGECKETLMEVHPCQMDAYKYNCNHSNSNWLLLLLFVLCIISTIMMMIIRWVKNKRDFKKCNMNLVKEGKFINANDANNDHTSKKYKLQDVFLFLLLGLQISHVKACLKRTDNGHFLAVGGSTLCTTVGNHTMHLVGYELILSQEYLTSDWSVTYDSDWGCVGGSCPDATSCIQSNELPPINTGKPNQFSKQFCHYYPGACAFSGGYRMGNIAITLSGDIYRVNRISMQRAYPTLKASSGCLLRSKGVPDILGGNHMVLESSSKRYICPMDEYRDDPTFNELGDLQFKLGYVQTQNEFHVMAESVAMDWRALTCGHKWYDSRCDTPVSFISKLPKLCSIIPGPYAGGVMSTTINGEIVYTTNKPMEVDITCSGSEIIEEQADCKIVRKELWGIRSHGTGVYLTVVAISKNPNQDATLTNPCTGELMLVPCDGKIHFYAMSENVSNQCNNSTDNTITDFQAWMTGNFETSLTQGAPLWFSLIYIVGSSIIGFCLLLILIVAIYLHCKI